MNTTWKYAMIKVAEECDLETNEKIEDICELVELYQNGLGEWTSFCRPSSVSYTHLTLPTIYSV